MKKHISILLILFTLKNLQAQELTIYNFENLTSGLVQGQDNWQVLGCHTYQPTINNSNNQGNYSGSKVLQITSTAVGNQHSNCDRLNDNNWWVPTITDTTDFLVIDIDMNGGYWGKEFSLCYDKNLDGNFTESCNNTDNDEKGISIIKVPGQIRILNNNVQLAQSALIPEWAKYRMVIDLKANNSLGKISAFHQYLPDGTWNEFTNIQNIEANFDFNADHGGNPKKLNGMKIESEAGSTAQYDNIKLRTFQRINDYYFCKEDSINVEITKNIPEASYEWHDGTTENSITLKEVGSYFLKIIIDDLVTVIDSFEIQYYDSNITLDLGENKILCPNETLTIGTDDTFEGFMWNTGQTINEIEVNSSGVYILETLDSNECRLTDTIIITDFNYNLDLGKDSAICNNDTIIIGESNNLSVEYQWNTGSTENIIEVFNSGTYILEVTKDGCTISDSINILKHNSIQLANDTILCNNDTYTISVDPNYDSFQWNNGDNHYQTVINSPGEYWVTTQKGLCQIFSDTITISYDYSPVFNIRFQDLILCDKELRKLHLNATNFDQVLWSNNTTGEKIIIKSEGTYWVKLSNYCGTNTDEFKVTTKNCNCAAFIPNTFTPNSDKLNDMLEIKMNCKPTNFKLSIYNRWGEVVYKTTNYQEFWNGKFKGKTCPEGVYNIKLDIKFENEPNLTQIRRITLLE
jgi:gliding motility-associated-like protein